MIPDRSLSIDGGAITVLGWQSCMDTSSFTNAILQALAKEYKFRAQQDTAYANKQYKSDMQRERLYAETDKRLR